MVEERGNREKAHYDFGCIQHTASRSALVQHAGVILGGSTGASVGLL